MGYFYIMLVASAVLDTIQFIKIKPGKKDKIFYYSSMILIFILGTLYYKNVFDMGIIDYINKSGG